MNETQVAALRLAALVCAHLVAGWVVLASAVSAFALVFSRWTPAGRERDSLRRVSLSRVRQATLLLGPALVLWGLGEPRDSLVMAGVGIVLGRLLAEMQP